MDIRDHLLFLLVFLNMIDQSKEGCEDYFTIEQWKKNTTSDKVTLAQTNHSRDVVECTLNTYCKEDKKREHFFCFVLADCFEKWNGDCSSPSEVSDNVTIHLYHFMCMTEKKYTDNPSNVSEFCKYEAVCNFFAETTNSDRTSPPQPTTTLLQTTTAFKPTTTLQPPTTTTLPPKPTTTSPPPPITTAAVPIQGLGSMDKQGQNGNDKAHQDKDCPDILILRLLLSITSVLTVVLPLAVYFYMRKQRLNFMSNPTQANGNATHLTQLMDYPFTIAPSSP